MEPMEFRFRGKRAALEAVCVPVACGLLSLFLKGRLPPAVHAGAVLGASVLVVLMLALLRWRSRLRIDRDGIEKRRSRTDVAARLEWEDVDEIFLLNEAEFEVRGAGKAVRFSGVYADPGRARELVSARLAGLRDRLRDRALTDGQLEFRMPVTRWQAHVSYLLAILFLAALTSWVVGAFFLRRPSGFPFVFILFGGWFWSLRRSASRLGTRVSLFRDGLLVRRLDGKDRVAWAEVGGTEWDAKGGLVLVLRSGKRIPLPFNLANIAILEEFVEERRQAASARP